MFETLCLGTFHRATSQLCKHAQTDYMHIVDHTITCCNIRSGTTVGESVERNLSRDAMVRARCQCSYVVFSSPVCNRYHSQKPEPRASQEQPDV
jgi:hypothetical protein